MLKIYSKQEAQHKGQKYKCNSMSTISITYLCGTNAKKVETFLFLHLYSTFPEKSLIGPAISCLACDSPWLQPGSDDFLYNCLEGGMYFSFWAKQR